MKRDEFLCLRHWPARLTTAEVSWILGFNPEHVTLLVADGLLRPLGDPPQNGHKFFHRADVLEFAEDRRKMAKASDLLVNTWKLRNRRDRKQVEGILERGNDGDYSGDLCKHTARASLSK